MNLTKMYPTLASRKTDGAQDDIPELAVIDENLVTFDGPKDPLNPKNWPSKKKWIATLIMALYAFLAPFASSILVCFNHSTSSKPSGSRNRSDKRRIRRDKHHHSCVARFHLRPCVRNWSIDRWSSVGDIWKVRCTHLHLIPETDFVGLSFCMYRWDYFLSSVSRAP